MVISLSVTFNHRYDKIKQTIVFFTSHGLAWRDIKFFLRSFLKKISSMNRIILAKLIFLYKIVSFLKEWMFI